MFATPLVLLSLCASTLATVYTTSPTESTTFTGGQQATISWQDDGKTPSLASFGLASVSIYVGNALQQTSLQTIVPSVNVSTTASIQFTPDPKIGPNSAEYFVRFESLGLKDPSSPQYPALAFSAKFTMQGMTGTFSDAVQAQINGQSTAPLAGQTTSSGPATSTPSASLTTSTTKSSTSTSTKASASATHSSAAVHVEAGWLAALIGAVVGVSMF